MATPEARFALAARREAAEEPDAAVHEATEADLRAVTRRVGHSGKISLAGELYHVGTYLAGETVSLELTDGGLVQVSHHGVLVASHARRRPPANGGAERPPARAPGALAGRDRLVIRLVDTTGYVSFAGTGYWLGVHHRGQQVEVRRVGDSVEIGRAACCCAHSRRGTTAPRSTAPSRLRTDAHIARTRHGTAMLRVEQRWWSQSGTRVVGLDRTSTMVTGRPRVSALGAGLAAASMKRDRRAPVCRGARSLSALR